MGKISQKLDFKLDDNGYAEVTYSMRLELPCKRKPRFFNQKGIIM